MINDVDPVGKRGENKRVTEGFARNFLFPRNLAVLATEGSLKNMKLLQASWTRKTAKEKEAAKELAEKLNNLSIRVTKRAGDKGRLFGSVTNSELAELIQKETKIEVDKKSIVTDHIKELGQHEVIIKLAPEEVCACYVISSSPVTIGGHRG